MQMSDLTGKDKGAPVLQNAFSMVVVWGEEVGGKLCIVFKSWS